MRIDKVTFARREWGRRALFYSVKGLSGPTLSRSYLVQRACQRGLGHPPQGRQTPQSLSRLPTGQLGRLGHQTCSRNLDQLGVLSASQGTKEGCIRVQGVQGVLN